MSKNGNMPSEPVDYDVVEVTLDVSRTGWEVAERFAARYGLEPLKIVEQAVEQRLGLLFWLMDRADQKVIA